MNISQEELVEIYNVHKNELYSFSNSIVKNDHNAEDCVQETFRKLLTQNFEDTSYIRAWLYTVCKNFSLRQLKKSKRISYQRDEELYNDIISEDASPSENLDLKDNKILMNEKFSILSPKQLKMIKLRYYSDLSYNQIAEKMKTTSGNVGFMLCTGLQKLRAKMQN